MVLREKVKEKMTEKKTNPNGSNQHKPDPRQSLFITNYFDPNSDTFSNAYQSAIDAGYSKEYAENITALMPTWLSESIGDDYLVKKAEDNLKEMLEMQTKEPVVTMVGVLVDKDTGEVITKENTNLKRIQADVSKFVLERLNKKKYAARSEFTGAGGDQLKVALVEFVGEEPDDGIKREDRYRIS